MATLTPEEMQIARALVAAGSLDFQLLVQQAGIDQAKVAVALASWQKKGWLREDVRLRKELILAGEVPECLPERRFLEALPADTTRLPLADAAERAQELGIGMSAILNYGARRAWFRKDKKSGQLLVAPEARQALEEPQPDEKLLALAAPLGRVFLDALDADEAARAEKLLKGRSQLAKIKPRKQRQLELTDEGREALSNAQVVREVNELSSEQITTGEWRELRMRAYDVALPAEVPQVAKRHPLVRILSETRRVFLEMGFREVVSPMVESAFWDFDALFQPQDHPAREMQDTFYMAHPAETSLPRQDLVDAVSQVHVDGGDTGSTGWGYKWKVETARRALLRTHTTATSVRALAERPEAPQKIFCVGRVFRNETISFKHLPEFHQVDGIIIDEGANFRRLLGTLAAFYKKMGFEKVKFKPAFFPYTEPSTEVFVFMESRQQWIELGGAGIFRPEVTRPLGCEHPVLAWGLGLERLAMLRLGASDIRQLYTADLDWLRETRSCL